MNIEQLRYLVAVASFSSINQAATALHMSQPNLSLALRSLEEELGYELMNRTHKGVELTARGLLFLEQAKQVLLQFDNLQGAAGPGLCAKPSLSVAGMPLCHISEIMGEYLSAHPDDLGSLSMEMGLRDTVIDLISGQDSDVGIIYTYETSRRTTIGHCTAKNVQCTTLSPCRAVALIGPGNPLFESCPDDFISTIDLKQYYRLSFGKMGRPSYSRTFVPNLEDTRGEIVVDDQFSFINVLRTSPAFSLIPCSTFRPFGLDEASGLRTLCIDAAINGEYLFLKHTSRALNVAGEEFFKLAGRYYRYEE